MTWHKKRFIQDDRKVHVNCENCGIDMWLPKSKVSMYLCCSIDCRKQINQKARQKRERSCETCGAKFIARQTQLDAGGGRFCSAWCNTVSPKALLTDEAKQNPGEVVARTAKLFEGQSDATVARIPVGNGRYCLVDSSDFSVLSLYQWWVLESNQCGNKYQYARGTVDGTRVLMHRFIMGPSRHEVVDHISGDGLDNRRANLRVCTQAENMRNRRIASHNKSGFKGVYGATRVGGGVGWRAQIVVNRKKINLGTFGTPEEAYAAYISASKRYHGEFGRPK